MADSQVSGLVEQVKVGNTTHNLASTAYGICDTAAGTAAKTVNMTGFYLTKGVTVHIKFTNANSAASPTLDINETGAMPIVQYGTTAVGKSSSTDGWYAGAVVSFTYDGTSWVRDQGFNTNTTYSYMRPYGSTASGTAAKTGTAGWKFQLSAGKYFMFTQYYDNTAQSALTLNIGSTGAKPIYINGSPSSASNYTLPGGQYLVYYDGTNYHFRTDDKIPGNIAGDAATVNGLTVQTAVPANAIFTDTNKYHKSGSWSGLTYTATAVNSADELKFTIPTGTSSTTVALGNHNHDGVYAPVVNGGYLPLSGGVMTGNIRRRYSAASNDPMITMLSVNQDIILWEAGHDDGGGISTTTSNHYKLLYKGTGSDSNNSNYLQLIAHKTSDLVAVQIDEVGNVSLPQMNLGSATKPIYLNNGVITEGTILGASAYHDDSYFALASHGNHVPATQTANNITFLRNDNSWYKLTKNEVNTLINLLDTGASDLAANDYVITQYVGGGTTTTTYHRRPASKVVNATLVKAALGTDSSTTTQWLNKKGLWSTPTAADVGAITKLSSSTDNAIVRFDGTSGAIQNSGVIIDDNGTIALPTEQDINFRMNRKKADGGGWAHGYLKWYDNADNIFAVIGLYGTNDAFDHIYIGANTTYSADTNLQIFSNGTIKGKLFSGSGASLTNLNASNLSSGTVPVARLPLATTDAAGVVKIGSGISVNDGTISVSAANLGLSSALRYQGTTTTVMSDGLTTAAVTIGGNSYTPTQGDVVIYGDAEYLWTGSLWELIGAESSFKKVQTAVSTSTASGSSATTFVSSVTQDTQGVITVKTSTLDTSGTWSGTASKATTTADTTNALYPIGVTSGATTTLKRDTSITMTGGAVAAITYKATHAAGGQKEFEVTYGTAIDMAFMIGTGNENHGIYDYKKGSGAWVLSAGSNHNWELNGNAATATVATKLTTSNLGSSTKPIYLAAGVATEGSTYAGGTAVTLNGSNKGSSTASFYAPTSAGTTNHILISNSSGVPVWTTVTTLASATSTTANTAAYDVLTLGNSANVSTTTAHSEGKIVLYSAATAAHTIVGASTTTEYTHTLPNSSGTLLDTTNWQTVAGIEIIRLE